MFIDDDTDFKVYPELDKAKQNKDISWKRITKIGELQVCDQPQLETSTSDKEFL